MYRVVFVAFLLVSTVTCEFRSISGHLVPNYSFPYVVSIQFRPDMEEFGVDSTCTGSIIDKNWILTSAECIHGSSNFYQIQAGTKIVGKYQGVIRDVSGIFVHPDFNNDDRSHISNDVALVRLIEPLEFNENISSIELGTLQSEDVIVVGWGRTLPSQSILKNKDLNFVLLEVMEIEQCKDLHNEVNNEVDSRTHICAYGGIDTTPCHGDLGGPLVDVTTARLVGVFSGLEDCSGKYPAVFMKISEYIDWINSVTGLNLSLD